MMTAGPNINHSARKNLGSCAAPWTAHCLLHPTERQSNSTMTHTCQPAIQLQQSPQEWAHPCGESTRLCYHTMFLQLYLTARKTDASLSCCTPATKRNGSQQPILATKFLITPGQMFTFVFWGGKWKTWNANSGDKPALKLNTIKT